jgi:hypothetical protein
MQARSLVTDILRLRCWVSYNRTAFKEVQELQSYATKNFEYDVARRAQIFRRDEDTAQTAVGFQEILR